jgi:hypothetical protein
LVALVSRTSEAQITVLSDDGILITHRVIVGFSILPHENSKSAGKDGQTSADDGQIQLNQGPNGGVMEAVWIASVNVKGVNSAGYYIEMKLTSQIRRFDCE